MKSAQKKEALETVEALQPRPYLGPLRSLVAFKLPRDIFHKNPMVRAAQWLWLVQFDSTFCKSLWMKPSGKHDINHPRPQSMGTRRDELPCPTLRRRSLCKGPALKNASASEEHFFWSPLACFSYSVVGHSCSSWLPGAFWGALNPLAKFWSCRDLPHSVDSFNLPMPHKSGLEITTEVSNKCITSAVRIKKEENQSVVSSLREDGAAGGSCASRLLTMLTLLDLGRHFGGLATAQPSHLLCQCRA